MSKLDPRIEAVRQKYGLDASDFWQIPQNRQWVCKHAALEVVATKANVEWSPPQVIEANTAEGIAVMAVSGRMGDRVEWSTGEASPKNNKNSYPWAMAEKRAKDRVILKLVGIHGLVYSEDEADDFKAARPAEPPTRSSASLKRDGEWEKISEQVHQELLDVHTLAGLETVKEVWREFVRGRGWTPAWKAALADIFDGKEQELMAAMEAAEMENT